MNRTPKPPMTADPPARLRDASGLASLGAAALAQGVLSGQFSAVEVARAHLEQHHHVDAVLNAIVHLDTQGVLEQAARLDERVATGTAADLPLAGVPVAIKDNIDVRGEVTATGSRAHANAPAAVDAPVVVALRESGAVVFGRANMDELAMGASTQTSAFGPTRNPVDPRRSPGGSSGGSAAAVASHQVPLSVGSDTGGSIREPSSQCGIFGLAPSPHSVSAAGVVPFMPSLDRVGPLARTATDLGLLLSVLAGRPDLAPCAPCPLRCGWVSSPSCAMGGTRAAS